MSERRFIPVAEPVIGEPELAYVTDAVRSSWVSSKGPYVEVFEAAMARLCGTEYAIAVSSGTTALHVALAALDIGPGDEVIVPTFTFVATASTVRHVGATPVFADADPGHWCIDVEDIEHRITPRTKAIIPVHIYGHPADMDAIRSIAQRHGLRVIEDAAEALCATYKGQPTGGLSDMATFSFFGNKLITTGEGGMVVTNDATLAERLRRLREHGQDPQRRYWYPEVGFNFRLTNLQAAVGVGQVEQVSTFLERKQEIAQRYREGLSGIPGIRFQQTAPWATNSWWLFTILIDEEYGLSRDALAAQLLRADIDCRRVFYPIHTMPPYRTGEHFPVAERLGEIGLNLPSGAGLSATDQGRVVDRIGELAGARVGVPSGRA